jgi:hypothetical protein
MGKKKIGSSCNHKIATRKFNWFVKYSNSITDKKIIHLSLLFVSFIFSRKINQFFANQ